MSRLHPSSVLTECCLVPTRARRGPRMTPCTFPPLFFILSPPPLWPPPSLSSPHSPCSVVLLVNLSLVCCPWLLVPSPARGGALSRAGCCRPVGPWAQILLLLEYSLRSFRSLLFLPPYFGASVGLSCIENKFDVIYLG